MFTSNKPGFLHDMVITYISCEDLTPSTRMQRLRDEEQQRAEGGLDF